MYCDHPVTYFDQNLDTTNFAYLAPLVPSSGQKKKKVEGQTISGTIP
jgi:hypothetical protein